MLTLDDDGKLKEVSVSKSVDVTLIRSDGAHIIRAMRGEERHTELIQPVKAD